MLDRIIEISTMKVDMLHIQSLEQRAVAHYGMYVSSLVFVDDTSNTRKQLYYEYIWTHVCMMLIASHQFALAGIMTHHRTPALLYTDTQQSCQLFCRGLNACLRIRPTGLLSTYCTTVLNRINVTLHVCLRPQKESGIVPTKNPDPRYPQYIRRNHWFAGGVRSPLENFHHRITCSASGLQGSVARPIQSSEVIVVQNHLGPKQGMCSVHSRGVRLCRSVDGCCSCDCTF